MSFVVVVFVVVVVFGLPVLYRGLGVVRRSCAIRSLRRAASVRVCPYTSLLVGSALGDAFGAGVEMMDRDAICSLLASSTSTRTRFQNRRRDAYAINYWPGRFTDDAEHSLVVAQCLRADGVSVDANELVRRFEREWFSGVTAASGARQLFENLFAALQGRIAVRLLGEDDANVSKRARRCSLRALVRSSLREGRQGHGCVLCSC